MGGGLGMALRAWRRQHSAHFVPGDIGTLTLQSPHCDCLHPHTLPFHLCCHLSHHFDLSALQLH